MTTSVSYTGRVKWFNNKAGYGFITVTDGEMSGKDVFTHHSAIVVSSEQYKYLVQGEYVSFSLSTTTSGSHEYQASDVSGINGGKLMCETRWEARHSSSSGETQTEGQSVSKPRARGQGPRSETRKTSPSESSGWTTTGKSAPRQRRISSER